METGIWETSVRPMEGGPCETVATLGIDEANGINEPGTLNQEP